MSRFSPRVLPQAVPGFAEHLANAISGGYQTYQQTRERTEARQMDEAERARRAARDADRDAIDGIFDAGESYPGASPNGAVPDAFVGPSTGDELADALSQRPDIEGIVPRSASGVPGGYDPVAKRFARVEPVRLPSGRMYDPQRGIDQRLAGEMQSAQQKAHLAELARTGELAERVRLLEALRTTPGYEGLTDAMIQAAATDDQLFRETARPQAPKAPVRGTPEHLAVVEAEAAARRRGAPPVRSTPSEPKDPVEAKVQTEVAAFIRQGIEEEDPTTFSKRRRRPSDREVQEYADQVRRSLRGEFQTEPAPASSPADRWEQLVDSGMSPAQATAQVRREFPQ